MRKVIYVLLFALICVLAFGDTSSAAPKAFDYYGFYDPAGKLGEPERAALNATIKETYDKYGFSLYMCLLSGESMKMSEYAADFHSHNIAPYLGEIKYGVLFAWDEQTSDAYAIAFPNTDNRMVSAFTSQFLVDSMNTSFAAATSGFEALNNMATALQKRAGVYFGTNTDKKALDYYGFSDPTDKLGAVSKTAINALLRETYDKYGFSLYICLLSGEDIKMSQYATKFINENITPYVGEIKYGVVFAWDEQTNDAYAVAFPNSDSRVTSNFATQFLLDSMNSSFASASSVSEALKNMANALQKRAGEFYNTIK